MKNSAWYHKLWLNKLSDLPIKEDADTAWSGMEQLLDQQLPVGNSPSGTPAPKPSGTTLGTYFSYVISAAAMVGITAYFTLRSPEQAKVSKVVKDKNIVQVATDTLSSDTVIHDTIVSDVFTVDALPDKLAATSSINSPTPLKTSDPVIRPPAVPISASIDAVLAINTIPDTDTLDDVKTNNRTIAKNVSGQTPARQLPSDLTVDTESAKLDQTTEKRSVKVKTPINTPPYNFGLEAGVNRVNDENTLYFGAFGTYALSQRWLISTGLRLNTPRSFTGKYTRESYFRPDSMPAFSFTDKRKVLAMDIPLTLTYKLSNTISINAGPIISLPLKQLGIKLGTILQKTDTLMHTKTVYDILNNTKMNRINIGFSTGISLHFSQFDIHTRYQILSPYKFSNEFGDNKFKYRSFQIGIGYRFK